MPKNIVVLADGTGQEGGKGAHLNTNIYKMLLMLEDRSARQVVYYDRGVGVGWRRIAGGVTGAGIARNVQEAYRFIHDEYKDGDRIFLFGFSRGAATVRSLAGFMQLFPELPKSRPDLIRKAWKIYRTRAPAFVWRARRRIARYPAHRATGSRLARRVRRLLRRPGSSWNLADPVHVFTALLPLRTHFEFSKAFGYTWEEHVSTLDDDAWESRTIADLPDSATELDEAQRFALDDDLFTATGITRRIFDECTPEEDPRRFMRTFERWYRATHFINAASGFSVTGAWDLHFLGCFDTVSALGLPFPRLNALFNRIPGLNLEFHNMELGHVVHAYQALALNERRAVFEPDVWSFGDREGWTARQVWFTGSHTDVGGGYLERGLSDVTLGWMLTMAHRHGLLLRRSATLTEDPLGVMHDSSANPFVRLVFGERARSPRTGPVEPIIHESVFERLEADAVWESRKGRPVEVSSAEYRREIEAMLGHDSYEVEPKEPFDNFALAEIQERLWDAWAAAGYPHALTLEHPRYEDFVDFDDPSTEETDGDVEA